MPGSWSIFPWSGEDEEVEGDYRCLRCATAFERNYRECPECGGRFVAPLSDAE